jgi:hypothetical protein
LDIGDFFGGEFDSDVVHDYTISNRVNFARITW